MLTTGTPNAAAADVSMCFISTESQVQYDLGPETYVSSPKLILTPTPPPPQPPKWTGRKNDTEQDSEKKISTTNSWKKLQQKEETSHVNPQKAVISLIKWQLKKNSF